MLAMGGRCAIALAVACVLGGCDVLFGVDRLYDCPIDDDDCDELLDRDDPCPADPGDAADADGDDVGDACDPNVDAPVDQLLEFESFTALDTRWMPRGEATWQIHRSVLELSAGWVERAV